MPKSLDSEYQEERKREEAEEEHEYLESRIGYFRELLRKYIQHVAECEGTDFLSAGHLYADQVDPPVFSKQEVIELRRLGGWSDDGMTLRKGKAEP